MFDSADGYTKQPPCTEHPTLEASNLSAVQGPGIVEMQGRGSNGEMLLARAACSLADVLHERGPLSEGEVRAVGTAAAAALARVHDAGLVHGDVKPANLLLSAGGELWLADFDAAAAADGRPLERYSPGRLPPGAPALPASDIAALALALVELSTGTPLDPSVAWRAADLRLLGCSPALSAQIAFMLAGEAIAGREGSALSAHGTAEMFGHGSSGTLPAPAAEARCVDPTPTVDFMPAHHPLSDPSRRSEPAATEPPTRWWQRLAATWQRRQPS